MPREQEELDIMLHCFMLDKAIYELGYELNNRPAWVSIPLRSIIELLAGSKAKQ
jgi:maltose alpha-D-glucosyltransferase / alpha-amylase